MADRIYLAVDLGTSFIKAGAYGLDGVCRVSASEPVKGESREGGVFLQHGEELLQSACRCIRKVTDALGNDVSSIRAVAFTGQMAGAMGIDETGGDVTAWSCSLDTRYLPWAEQQRRRFGDDIFAIGCTGAPLMCSKYAWFRDTFPEEHHRIAKYVMLPAFLIGRLSDTKAEDAMIDYSLIAWTGLADVKNGCWSEKLCGEMGVDLKHLPRIASSDTVGGSVNAAGSAMTGLPVGTPLVLGAGDKVCGCLGAGITHYGDTVFEASSYGAVSCLVPETRPDTDARRYDIICGLTAADRFVHKYIPCSGVTTNWFVDRFYRDGGFDAADAEAMAVRPGSGKMLTVGLLNGSAMPFDAFLRGTCLGIGYETGRGAMYRSLVEGFAYDLERTLKSLRKYYPEYASGRIRLIGGAAHSPLWQSVFADVTGQTFDVVERSDVAMLGAALIAAKGVGDITSLQDAAEGLAPVSRSVAPDDVNRKIYEPYVKLYAEAVTELHGLFERLNAIEEN